MKKLISNYLFTVMYQLLLIVTPFITTPYVSRVLRAQGVGVEATVAAVVQLFIVFISLSFSLYGSRQIASKQNQRETSEEFWSIFLFKIISSLVVLIIYFLYVNGVSNHKDLYWINSLTLLANIIDISWYFFGKEQIKTISIRNMVVKIIGIVLIFTFVKESDDLDLYVLINAGTLLIGQLIMWIPLIREVSFVKITYRTVAYHFKPIMILFLPQIMIQIYVLVNKIILGNESGEIEVGYYNQAYKVITIALGVISSLGSVMLPRMASEFNRGNKEEMEKYVNFALQLILLITLPMTLGMMGIAPNFIAWFLGEEFKPVINLLIIMSPVMFFVGLANVFGIQILIGTNQQNKYSVAVTIGAILSLLVNFLLIKPLASTATSIALLVAEGVGALIQIYYAKNYFNIKMFFRMLFKYFTLSAFVYISVFIAGKYLALSPVLLTFIQITAGMLTYLVGLIIMKEPMVLRLFETIKFRLKMGDRG
jgi:O-antigen/teichoic acid export membrane protein